MLKLFLFIGFLRNSFKNSFFITSWWCRSVILFDQIIRSVSLTCRNHNNVLWQVKKLWFGRRFTAEPNTVKFCNHAHIYCLILSHAFSRRSNSTAVFYALNPFASVSIPHNLFPCAYFIFLCFANSSFVSFIFRLSSFINSSFLTGSLTSLLSPLIIVLNCLAFFRFFLLSYICSCGKIVIVAAMFSIHSLIL